MDKNCLSFASMLEAFGRPPLVIQCVPTFEGKYKAVEVMSASKISVCDKCLINFTSPTKLKSHVKKYHKASEPMGKSNTSYLF